MKTPKFVEYWVNEVIRRTNGPGAGNARVFGMGGDRINLGRGVAPGGAGADAGPVNRPFAGRGVRLGGM